MGLPLTVLAYPATALVSHYIASFIQISLHYLLGHRALGGFFYRTHMFDHHGIYSGDQLLSETYSDKERDLTAYYVVPAALLVLAAYLLLPTGIFLVHILSIGLSYAAHVYLHVHYHLKNSWLNRFRWFEKKRRLHLVHHREPSKNFAVIEFFWDRIWGTYQSANP